VVLDRDGTAMLLARMTYGANKGRYMIPGGLLDPGETLDAAAVREVREETGIEARPLGIIGVRSRFDGDNSDSYVVWLMELVSDGDEFAAEARRQSLAIANSPYAEEDQAFSDSISSSMSRASGTTTNRPRRS
jgi:8-oxo-dGTP pyrophosphatase MutT (NUDIX family)